MATGACGIACDACRLHRRGICSSCGGGTTEAGIQKIAEQKRLLGAPCPILACARLNRIDYCMADCDSFPCENFNTAAYPFSEGFINMQKRRRQDLETSLSSDQPVLIPRQHWQTLKDRDPAGLQAQAGGQLAGDGLLHLVVLDQELRVDPANESVEISTEDGWVPAPTFLGFVTVIYLVNVIEIPVAGRWVSEKDLSCASFFRNIHQLPVARLINRFGESPGELRDAAERFGGVATDDGGDISVRLWVFPRIPLKLILWCSDEMLPASITVLFDQSIDQLLPADGIWAMVNLVGDWLVNSA